MADTAIEHVILTAALLVLCFSFFWVSVGMMQSLVNYGFQVKLTNIGNYMSYHIVSVYSLVNTSNVALTVNKTITLPKTLEANVLYNFTLIISKGFSVLELYTISPVYSFNIQLPKIVVNVTLPQTIVLARNITPISPFSHTTILIEVMRNSLGYTTLNII